MPAKRWERSGCHPTAAITLTAYQHVRTGMGREAADGFTALLMGGFRARSITRDSKAPTARNTLRL
jgi:hypothetical protein